MAAPTESSPSIRHCLGCSYDLRGLPENRCPECGRCFDPDDPGTFVTNLRSGRRYLTAAAVGVVAMAIPQVVICLSNLRAFMYGLAWPIGTGLTLLLFICLLGGFLTEVHVLRSSSLALFGEPGAARHRHAFAVSFVVSWLIVFGSVLELIALLVMAYPFVRRPF